MNTDPRIRTLAEARQQVGIDTGRTFAWDDLNPIEQGNALAVAAAWLEAAVAAGIAPLAAVPVPPPADQTALRDRIRRVLCVRDGQGALWGTDMLEPDEYGADADAVLAVLPEQTDRAAVIAEAADIAERVAIKRHEQHEIEREQGALDVMTELRRVAAEEQPAETQAHPPEHTWAAELHDPLADEWVPGTRYLVRERAVKHLAHARSVGPTWKDGTPTQRRLVRATTTYTVEAEHTPPAVGEQPGKQTAACDAVSFRVRHNPHIWEPEPDADLVRCPGFSRTPE